MGAEDLGEACRGKWMLGADVEGWSGETVRWRELGAEEKCEEELGFTSTAVEKVLAWMVEGVVVEERVEEGSEPLASYFSDIAGRYSAPQCVVQLGV